MVSFLVEGPHQFCVPFGAQVCGTEGYVALEEEMRMQVRRSRSAYTQTTALEFIPREGIVDRSEIPFTLSPTRSGHCRHVFGHEGVRQHDETIELRRSLGIFHQIKHRTLIERKGFRSVIIPPFEVLAHRDRVIGRYGIPQGHGREDLRSELSIKIKVCIEFCLPRQEGLFAVNEIELTKGSGPIRRPKSVVQFLIVMFYREIADEVKVDMRRDIDSVFLDLVSRVIHDV